MISTVVSRVATWLLADKRRPAACAAALALILGVNYYNEHKATSRDDVCNALTDLQSRLQDPNSGFFDNATFRASSQLGDRASRAAEDGTDLSAVHGAGAELTRLGDRSSAMTGEFESAAQPIEQWCSTGD